MKTLISFFALLLGICTHAQQSEEFNKILWQVDMSLVPLENFEKTPIILNDVMEYEYAAKNEEKGVEIRYAIRPITLREYSNEAERQEYLEFAETENTATEWYMRVAILNLSGGRESQIKDLYEFEKQRIGADWAASSFVVLNSEFSKEYKFCQLVVIQKKDRATCYCYFLANDIMTLTKVSRELRGNLRFN